MYDTNNGMNYSRTAAASPPNGSTISLPLRVNSFNFNIASQVINNTGRSNLSLISNITVESVDSSLNEVVVICTEEESGTQDMVKVHIFNNFQLGRGLCMSVYFYLTLCIKY